MAELLGAARTAMEQAYAPYSRFRVGAAVQASDGRVFTGCNVENASYGLTVCAERTAVVAAVAAGAREFAGIAVVASGPSVPYPCGACRQVLAEFCAPETPVWVARADRIESPEALTLGELLPKRFDL
jgi:homotetrameric cytidine deaminase